VRKRVICLQTIEKSVESSRPIQKNGAGEGRFDASHKHHPVTESSHINSLANSPYRSTVKTLPATLPELWSLVRGPRYKHIGPWSTDLVPRLATRGHRTGVTWAGCWIWSELGRGVGRRFGVVVPRTSGGWWMSRGKVAQNHPPKQRCKLVCPQHPM